MKASREPAFDRMDRRLQSRAGLSKEPVLDCKKEYVGGNVYCYDKNPVVARLTKIFADF